jgi:hypothetical protein
MFESNAIGSEELIDVEADDWLCSLLIVIGPIVSGSGRDGSPMGRRSAR